jgi:endonuclease/exonuclease/phosphatase family metal-dependent hydrolase
MRIATFNAGLAVGVLPNVAERLPHVLSALASLDVDVLFVQEFWLDSHFQQLCSLVREKLPHVLRQKPQPLQGGGCTKQQLAALRECALQHCHGLRDEALARCVVQHCASIALTLPGQCLNCIARDPHGTLDEIFDRCTSLAAASNDSTAGLGGLKAYGGSYGTGLLLKKPPLESDAIHFTSTVNARGALWARLQNSEGGELHLFAAHLSPGGFEQEPQVEQLLAWIESKAGSADAILVGDLNTTTRSALFQRFQAAGFDEDANAPRATFSSEGLLTGYFGESGWALDHVLVRGRLRAQTERILDFRVLLDSQAEERPSTLSDHAGLLATIERPSRE